MTGPLYPPGCLALPSLLGPPTGGLRLTRTLMGRGSSLPSGCCLCPVSSWLQCSCLFATLCIGYFFFGNSWFIICNYIYNWYIYILISWGVELGCWFENFLTAVDVHREPPSRDGFRHIPSVLVCWLSIFIGLEVVFSLLMFFNVLLNYFLVVACRN